MKSQKKKTMKMVKNLIIIKKTKKYKRQISKVKKKLYFFQAKEFAPLKYLIIYNFRTKKYQQLLKI